MPLNTRLAAPAAGPGCELISLADCERRQAAGPGPELDEPVSLDDPCMIMYTSGTTGASKGVTLTHANITWNAINVVVDSDFRADEMALVVAPLFHTAALNMLSMPTLLKGGTLVIEGAFDPGRALDLIAAHRVTSLFGVPAMYDALAAHPRWAACDLSSIRQLLCGGAPVPDTTIATWLTRGLTFIQGYGMTEASPGVLLLDAAHAQSKAGSAGMPHFFTDVRVSRPDLCPLGRGRPGRRSAAAGGASQRGGDPRLPGRTACPVQDPPVSPVRRHPAAHRVRQDTQEAAAGKLWRGLMSWDGNHRPFFLLSAGCGPRHR